MTWLDRLLQRWRFRMAAPFLPVGARVLDIGSNNGALFNLRPNLGDRCLGIDPILDPDAPMGRHRLVRGFFPHDMPDVAPFDVITMLAVLEHFPTASHQNLAAGCFRFLRPGGRLVITVPSPAVDRVLAILLKLRLIEGMSLEEHHGYDIRETDQIFSKPYFTLNSHRTFQLGLNNLFVFERVEAEQT